ncbi:LysR family transcriptional regulator [Limibacillus sp. MBR-115]|uniref:LysR family transcriptional regulator n=1 Tax=Limibacillus sp. MBR-115 TaxID=3156465 RepID=UPI003392DCDB
MKNWMNLRTLEIFVTSVEEENMSRAAERLGLTQSAVSQAIASLEKSTGAQLVDRNVRPARLTLLGTTFYKGAVALLGHARVLEQSVDLDMNKLLPLLRIGMVDSFAATVGPHLVKALDTIAAQWSVLSGVNETGIRALLERRVDFVITSDSSHNFFDLTVLPVLEEPFFIVAPPSNSKEQKTAEQLCEEMPLIRYSRSSFFGRQVDDYLRSNTLNPQHRYELDTSDAVLGMVSAGIGWTIATPLVVLKSVRSDTNLRIYPLSKPPMARTIRLIAQRTESMELSQRIAKAAQDAIYRSFLTRITHLSPWTTDALRIGGLSLSEFESHLTSNP